MGLCEFKIKAPQCKSDGLQFNFIGPQFNLELPPFKW
jgi:hypothetical protein